MDDAVGAAGASRFGAEAFVGLVAKTPQSSAPPKASASKYFDRAGHIADAPFRGRTNRTSAEFH